MKWFANIAGGERKKFSFLCDHWTLRNVEWEFLNALFVCLIWIPLPSCFVNKLSKFSIRFFDSLCFDSIYFLLYGLHFIFAYLFSFRTQTLFLLVYFCFTETNSFFPLLSLLLFLSFWYFFLSSLKLNIQSISYALHSTKYPPRPSNTTQKTDPRSSQKKIRRMEGPRRRKFLTVKKRFESFWSPQ